jgi:tetratricopeptide (TPR) repeat protein
MEAQLGAAHPEVALTVFNLGDLRFTLGGRKDYAGFEVPLRRALAAQQAGLAPGHPERVAPLMTAGVLFARTRRFEEAEQALNTAMKIAVEVEGPDGQTPQMVRAGFGILDQELASPAAEAYLLKGAQAPGTPSETGVRLWKLCRHYFVRNDAKKAEPYYRKLREIGEKLGESPEGMLLKAETGSYSAAYGLLGQDRPDDAASLVLGELEAMERVLPAGHAEVQQQRYFAGNVFRMMGRHKQALKLFQRHVEAAATPDGLMRLMDEQLWLGEKKDAERTAAQIERLTGMKPVMDPALNEFARQLQSVWHMLQLQEAPDLIGAALRRDPAACLVVGLCWSAGQGVPRSNEQARPWFEVAAQAGNPIAQDILGVLDKGADIQGDMESIVNCAKMWLDTRK